MDIKAAVILYSLHQRVQGAKNLYSFYRDAAIQSENNARAYRITMNYFKHATKILKLPRNHYLRFFTSR